jgi:flagellar hook-associated protein 2
VVANAGETLTIQHAGPADIALTVPAGGYSLNQLRDAINADPNNAGNVRAEVLFDGTSYRLVISGTQTGQANDVEVSSTINGGAFVDGALAQTAQDAQIRYVGIAITRPGNEIADAIPGLTLRLRGTNSATDTNDATTLTVERDLPGIQAKLQALADAYNAVRDFVNAQSAYDEATKQAGPLSGNGSLRTIERIVQSSVSGLYTLAGTSLSSLSEIGLRFDQDGKLVLDAAKLESALAADVSAVRTLLSGDGTDDGVATALARVLDPLTRLGDGVLAVQDQTYATTLRGFDDQIAELELRLEKREETLRRQFASLESLVGALQSQAGFLSSL